MTDPTDRPKCQLCGEPMPPGEEMFNFHGYSGPCPKPAAPAPSGGQADQPKGGYDPPPPDMSLDEQVRHARGFAQGICRNDHHVSRLLEQMARSIEGLMADQPAEPSERELPTHWGHWVRNGEHYWVYGKGPAFHIQRLNVETGLPHEDTADFAITLNSAEMRGHWRPAVPDRPGGRAAAG
jgi:hypothetical protein